jgi:hypothetical protein
MEKPKQPSSMKSTTKESAMSKLSQVSAEAMRLEDLPSAPAASSTADAREGNVDKFTVSIWPSDTRKIKEVRRWLEDQMPDATTLDRSKVLRLALRALETGPRLVELAHEMMAEESAVRKERLTAYPNNPAARQAIRPAAK